MSRTRASISSGHRGARLVKVLAGLLLCQPFALAADEELPAPAGSGNAAEARRVIQEALDRSAAEGRPDAPQPTAIAKAFTKEKAGVNELTDEWSPRFA